MDFPYFNQYIPDDMTDEDAAAVLTQGLTALTMLRESYAVQSGDTIV
jgi:NADPH:quinone reductase-like Zn-dependent oxidoreductase